MNVLSPRVEFEKGESVLGFAARLAASHADSRTGLFLTDMNIKLSDLAGSKAEAIDKLARCSGIPVDDLMANAPFGLGHRGFQLRGEFVSSEFLASPHTVFCPACLVDDDRASGGVAQFRRHRWFWQVRGVRTCNIHGLPLMRRTGGAYEDRFHELAIVVPEVGTALENLVPECDPRAVSPLQQYVLARLDGAAGPGWLDGEGLEQSVRASEMLGVLMAYGAKPNLDKFTEDDWDHAGAVGFGYTSRGEAGIRQALTEVQKAFKYNGSNPGAQAVFGRLYQWLARSRSKKDPGDIKRILREHILDTMPIPTNGIVLGEKLAARRLYTCASLARDTEVNPLTLRGMLIAKGLLPENASEAANHVFDSARGLEIAYSMGRLVPIKGLEKALGCSRPLVDQLLSDRILTPIVSELSYAPGRTKKGIHSAEIERLLDRIQSAATPVGKPREGMVDLATAAMKSNAPAVEIVHLILGGFLSNVVLLDGKAGFDGIRVDPAETKSLVSELMVGFSPAEAFARIRVPVPSGWELVQNSLLRAIEIHPKRGDHVIHRFRPHDIDAFLTEFITEARIGNALEMSLDDLKREMKAAGVKPFLRKREIGIRIFRRCDLPARFQV